MIYLKTLLVILLPTLYSLGQVWNVEISGLIDDIKGKNIPLLLIRDTDTLQKYQTDLNANFEFNPVQFSEEYSYFIVIDLPKYNSTKQWRTIYSAGDKNHLNGYFLKLSIRETSKMIHDTTIYFELNKVKLKTDFNPIYFKEIMDKDPNCKLYLYQTIGLGENEKIAIKREKSITKSFSKANLDVKRITFSKVAPKLNKEANNIQPYIKGTFSLF